MSGGGGSPSYSTRACNADLFTYISPLARQRSGSRMVRLVAIVGSLLVLSACAVSGAPEVVALPNGYYLQPDRNKETELVKRSGHRVLPGNVAAYAVSGQIVTGALGTASAAGHSYANDSPFHGDADTRYFVLDTRSGRLDQNLTADAWREHLKELGASSSLEIYPPLAWQ
jgi:hypothetical protein